MIRVKVLGDGSYESIFNEEDGFSAVERSPDVVCFTGGTDIDPEIYGAGRNIRTGFPDFDRDTRERQVFDLCKRNKIPMVGICRGSQLLCALNGGKLYQHVKGHGMPHEMRTHDDRNMIVTSSHHQMMNPWNERGALLDGAQLLGWSVRRSTTYQEVTEVDPPPVDPEVVYFSKTNSLCHQPHPEWMQYDAPYRRYFFETIHKYLEVK